MRKSKTLFFRRNQVVKPGIPWTLGAVRGDCFCLWKLWSCIAQGQSNYWGPLLIKYVLLRLGCNNISDTGRFQLNQGNIWKNLQSSGDQKKNVHFQLRGLGWIFPILVYLPECIYETMIRSKLSIGRYWFQNNERVSGMQTARFAYLAIAGTRLGNHVEYLTDIRTLGLGRFFHQAIWILRKGLSLKQGLFWAGWKINKTRHCSSILASEFIDG